MPEEDGYRLACPVADARVGKTSPGISGLVPTFVVWLSSRHVPSPTKPIEQERAMLFSKRSVKFLSPLSVTECRSLLREQVAKRRWTVLFHPLTSTVVGVVEDENVVLESGVDRFSKRFVGKLTESQGKTVLDGDWLIPFWSRIWGDHSFDDEEVTRFLRKHAKLEPEPKLK